MKETLNISQNLPKGWRKVKLGEIADINMGQSPRSKFYNSRGDGLPFYQGVTDFGEKYPQKSIYCSQPTKIAEAGDVFFSVRAPVGEVNMATEKSCIGRGVAALRMKNKNNEFLYFLLKNYEKYFKGIAGGTTYESINKDQIEDIELIVPDNPNDQKRIADILSAFDEKIELNNKISKTLEQIAQAIFKEWFVNFRFPGHTKVKMVNSELGKIPEGWEVKKLSDLFVFIGGSQPPKSEHIYEEKSGYVRFIQNRDYASDSHKTYIRVSSRNKLCDELDILMDKYGEVGTVRFGIAGAYNVALAKLEPKQPHTREFLRFYFWQEAVRQMIESTAIASTRGSLNQNTFTGMEVVFPPKNLLERFNKLSRTILTKILQIKAENQKLAALRDLLLPKLMSGEVRV